MEVLKEYKTIFLSGVAVLVFCAAAYFIVGNAEQKDSRYTYAEHIFQENVVNEINIEIDETDWQDMLENPLEEEYHQANVTINGETIGNVAIRTKGNNTLTSVASSDSDRYSFKLDFDYYEDGGNYYGLKKLCLNNNYGDNSSMREYISYKIMGGMGIPVPGCGYSYITVNGEEWGLYLAVEAIDEVFLATHFEDAAGDLYKPDGTGADLVYRGDDLSEYTGLNLKTNEETSNGSAILALIQVLERGEGLEDVLDIESALKYIAANVALANYDSYLGNTTHNYYLYEQDGVFSVLPWDFNYAFGAFGGGEVDIYEPANHTMGGGGGNRGDRQKTEAAEEKGFGGMGGSTEKPLVTTLLENETFLSLYEGYLKEIAENYLTEEYMAALVTQVHDLIAPYVEQDATAFYTYEEFEQACAIDPTDEYSLVYYAVNMAASIQTQLAGGEPTFNTSSLKGGGMPDMGNMPDFGGEMPVNTEQPAEMTEAAASTKQPAETEELQKPAVGEKGGNRPEDMQGGPGMGDERGRQQVDIREVLPAMAVCGGIFAAGLVFTIVYKRKKDLK